MNLEEKKIDGDIVYKGVLTFEKDKVMYPNGRIAMREVIRHPGASAMLAKIGDKYIIEKQFRYPVGEAIYEIPAGKVDRDEDFEDCALREIEEECGYTVGKITHLGDIYTSPGFTDEKIAIFLCENLFKTKQNFD